MQVFIMDEEEFIYSDKIEQVAPLTLNLSIHITENDEVVVELRKKATINYKNKEFWLNFFSASLGDKPIKVNAQIVFRDKFSSASKLKDLNLLKTGTKIKE